MVSYWMGITRARTTRRRFLQAATLGTGVAALGVVACGGSDSEDVRSLATEPIDTTSKAVKGGTLQLAGGSPQTFDSLNGFGSDGLYATAGYSRLVKFKAYKFPETVLTAVDGDAADSWEVSPDGLQYTYRIRPNLKLDPRPPTNGRALKASDARFSFERYQAQGISRTLFFNSISKDAPITSYAAPDDRTFVVKLAFPYAPLNALLTYYRYIVILPAEADGGFDVRRDMRGSGAWRLKESVAQSRVELVKSPDWYDAAKVNFDGITYTDIADVATGMAQFRAGNLWTYGVPPHEILATKQSIPSLIMQAQEQFTLTNSDFRFSYLPGSPFRDERVRKALSMLIERDLIIETIENVDEFRKAGLNVATRWHTSVPAGEEGFWLDPKSAAFGENAKFYKFDPAEAKKFLRAAGHTGPITQRFTLSTAYAQPYQNVAAAIQSMWEEHGDFKMNTQVVDHNTDFTPNYYQKMNQFEGLLFHNLASHPEVDSWLYYLYLSNQPRSGHLDSNGQPDTVLDGMLAKQRQELDLSKRISLVHEIQRYAAGKMYLFHSPGAAQGFQLAWPYLANFGVYRSRSGPGGGSISETMPYLWYDASKKSA